MSVREDFFSRSVAVIFPDIGRVLTDFCEFKRFWQQESERRCAKSKLSRLATRITPTGCERRCLFTAATHALVLMFSSTAAGTRQRARGLRRCEASVSLRGVGMGGQNRGGDVN